MAMNYWIKCSERMPEPTLGTAYGGLFVEVLTFRPAMLGEPNEIRNLGVVKYDDDGESHYQWMYIMDRGNLERCDPPYVPSHWMPLPELPKDTP